MSDHSKEILRKEAILHRGRMFYDMEDTDQVLKHFTDSIKPQAGQVLASYWPTDSEFDTHPIMEHMLEIGVVCALPCVEKNSLILRFARWDTKTEMVSAMYEIFEPKEKDFVFPDIVLVPLLAFDRKGHRLGYGKGYYDATLSALRSEREIIAIGLAYAQQSCLFNLPVEEHDESLDWVITPQGAQYFGD